MTRHSSTLPHTLSRSVVLNEAIRYSRATPPDENAGDIHRQLSTGEFEFSRHVFKRVVERNIRSGQRGHSEFSRSRLNAWWSKVPGVIASPQTDPPTSALRSIFVFEATH